MIWGLDYWVLGGASAFAVVVALAGGLATDLGPWYRNLRKPGWKPPDWAFGPVWTTIFVLCVIAFAIGWREAGDSPARLQIVAAFVINGLLNIAWSVLFFTLKRPDWALVEVALLWLSIVALIVLLWPLSVLAAALIVPYLVWVSLAAMLNLSIVRLNGMVRTASDG